MSDCPLDPYSHRYTHCLAFGAQPCSAAAATLRTHFRLWAPASAEVRLEFGLDGAAEPAIEMAHAGAGWFETFVECGAGTRYRYRLDGTLVIPDPASRSQPDGVEAASEVIDPRAFVWRNTSWRGRPWEEIALYAIRPDAVGGYDQVRRRLPQLARLGVTALELLASTDPAQDSLPFAPIAAYGGPHALKALIDEAHGLGLAVLLDLDYARFGGGSEALRRYAAPFFQTRDDPHHAPLALDHPEVCDFFCDNALYWIEEYRCDGLRLRAADRIGNAGLREIADRVRAAVPSERLVHLVLGSERHPSHLADTHFDAQWNESGERALHRLTGRAAYPYREAISTRQTIHMLARALTADGSAYQRPGGGESGGWEGGLPMTSLVLSDGASRPTAATREAGLAALALSLLTPQIPLVFDEAAPDAASRRFVQSALAVRAKLIAPRLLDARPQSAELLRLADGGEADALVAVWRLGDGEVLSLALNLSPEPLAFDRQPDGTIVFETPPRARDRLLFGELPPFSLVAWVTGDVNRYALSHDTRYRPLTGAGAGAGTAAFDA
ncbi:DUF3459 domain-containing protein [Burkholderia glumae]|uniref:DUF3459 domain-containing protein n=1 Tax=Burkholderia glumae TaxID=337 RepID=A0AAQ0BS25_BURGL|nr:DUF3459 domain-containing protein [Burkholderia glumae]ACR31972.1 Alpha amylase family protein [Burkholderia glumae BGR1]AJY64246.1 carbohydrate-binding module 48 family protein [Burkholderia glumae LMG 2196 = ATCC 33617]KHJ59854.1 alpha-amylase [Burkholderia glumae]MCM2484857.1 DUF3459 domain-containing protein [Burkholderia glumae]MCM2495238.1 DUF3459 domain-containing protein [Burkholderia glumae]